MADIIIAFPKPEDGKKLQKLINRNGYEVNAICDNGADVLSLVNRLDGGIIISGYRFNDMYYSQLQELLPDNFEMLLLASAAKLSEVEPGTVTLAMPLKMSELLETLEMMLSTYERKRKKLKKKPKERTQKEKDTIVKAKNLLMERNNMTEDEAHRYIQKISMDSATNMVETAEMILELNGKEWEL